jgi:dienelactone hydrolase
MYQIHRAWRAATMAAIAAVVLASGINGALLDTGLGNGIEFLVGAAIGLVAVLVSVGLIAGLQRLLGGVPALAFAGVSGALLALWFLLENSPSALLRGLLDTEAWSWPLSVPDALSVLPLASIVLAAAACAAAVALSRAGSTRPGVARAAQATAIGITIVAAAVVLRLADHGSDEFPEDGLPLVANSVTAGLPNPATPGQWLVESMTYGAGPNERRPEFGVDRDLESRTVDISGLLPEWKDFKQRMRERYWGITLEAAPLNGRIWAPAGRGMSPLVLIVHGNHGMEDYSDAGYAWLGELLASRGFVAVSVDQNYINGTWSGDFQGKEMAARAALLLEHLALFRDWNRIPDHPFHARIDMDSLALIGHSRGGEAVSIAYAFNALPHFPDDATIAFDYGFNIRALVAIAQVDQRYHRRVELEDVNFFTIHGSYDSDEPAYHGLRQLNRIALGPDDYFIKAGVYLHGANHGQFNTGWGRTDYSPPGSWRLNLAPIIPGAEQRQAASAYIAAFLEATLHGDRRYVDLLKDPRAGAAWLPARTFVHQFTDSSFRPLATFEEDLDVSTATQAHATISTNGLSVWREEDLEHRDERKQGSNAVVVGWRDTGASLSIEIPSAADISPDRSLVFAVSGSTEALPEEDGVEEDDASDEGESEENNDVPTIADFSVELLDVDGNSATVSVSAHAALVPPVRVRYLKNTELNDAQYKADWEPVLQYVQVPFTAFTEANSLLDLSATRLIRFGFDGADEGMLIIDDIGTAALAPAGLGNVTE